MTTLLCTAVTIAFYVSLQIHKDFGQCINNIGCNERVFSCLLRSFVPGHTMHKDAEHRCLSRIQSLTQQRGDNTCQDIACSCGGHAWVPCGIDEYMPFRHGCNSRHSLQHKINARFSGKRERNTDPVRDLRLMNKPRHFTGMRGKDQGRLCLLKEVFYSKCILC